MSLGEAKLLFQRIDADDNFRARLTSIEDLDRRVEFINAHGFNLTLMEIRAALDTLSDEQLDNVAGGMRNVHIAPADLWALF